MQARIAVTPLIAATRPLTPSPFGTLQRKCACGGSGSSGGECAECKKKTLQRRAVDGTQQATAPPIVHEVLRSPGQPLDAPTRDFFEPRFGHDFGKVRVHADAKAAGSARAVGASAYAGGQHIAFAEGQYAPGSAWGRHLLAHELAHVVQQSAAGVSDGPLRVGDSGSSFELEADHVADNVVRLRTGPRPTLLNQPLVQRQPLNLAHNLRPTCAEKCGPSATVSNPINCGTTSTTRFNWAVAKLGMAELNLDKAIQTFHDAIANPPNQFTAAAAAKLRLSLRKNFGWSEGQAPPNLRDKVLQKLQTALAYSGENLWIECVPGPSTAIMQGAVNAPTDPNQNAGTQTVGSENCLAHNCFQVGSNLSEADAPHAFVHEVFHRVLTSGSATVDRARDVYRGNPTPGMYPGGPDQALVRPDSYASLVDDLIVGFVPAPVPSPAPTPAPPAPAPSH
jgi:hypothetical protein